MSRLLLAQCYDSTSFFDCSPMQYRDYLLHKFPRYAQWLPTSVFSNCAELHKDPLADFVDHLNMKINIGGSFIAGNLETPSTVLHAPAAPIHLIRELENGIRENRPYTHVGFGVFINGYSDFIECAKAVRSFDQRIVTIAGNVGALFEGTERYADLVHQDDGIPFFRELFHEDLQTPYRMGLISNPDNSHNVYLVSKVGCPNHCDFCITPRLLSRKAGRSFCTPVALYEKLVERRKQVGKDLHIVVSEPQAIVDPRWWIELFDLFRHEKETYTIHFGSSAVSLDAFDFSRITSSSLKIGIIQLGVESFSISYDKNLHVNIKDLISRLHHYGIQIYGSFIIGFDHHTEKSIREEIMRLSDLNIDMVSLMNYRPLPKTASWQIYRQQSRILDDIPVDFFYVPGFQAFVHPHFKSGFEDMLPIMIDMSNYLLEKTRNSSH